MASKPKLSTVAKEAGVSLATVSQVMRGTGRISDATRQRVMAAAQRIAYVPDARAAALRSGQNREIGLVIHKIANPFNAEVIAGVSDALETHGFLVSVLDSADDAEREYRNLEALIRNMRGGLLWVPSLEATESTHALLAAHAMPTVTFLRRSKDRMLDHVSIENMRATMDATNHLADLGHRHIAYLGGRRPTDARLERIDGYRRVMRERALGEELVISCADTKAAGFEIVEWLCRTHPQVSALVCNGDMVALGALAGLQRLGLVPGDDMSIVGFDNVQETALATPALTTMAVNPYALGKRLAGVLLDRLHQPDMPPVSVLVPADLVVRETTRPPRHAAQALPA